MRHGVDSNHTSNRNLLTLVAALLIGAGVIVGGLGAYRFYGTFQGFANPHASMSRDMSEGFSGVLFLGLGGFFVVVGANLLRFAQRGRLARYAVGELAPVAVDTVGYVAQESQEALRQVGAALSSGAKVREVVKVRCRACGALDSEDARFCSACGKAI